MIHLWCHTHLLLSLVTWPDTLNINICSSHGSRQPRAPWAPSRKPMIAWWLELLYQWAPTSPHHCHPISFIFFRDFLDIMLDIMFRYFLMAGTWCFLVMHTVVPKTTYPRLCMVCWGVAVSMSAVSAVSAVSTVSMLQFLWIISQMIKTKTCGWIVSTISQLYPNYIPMINPWKLIQHFHHLQLAARSPQQAAGQVQFTEQVQMQSTGHFFRHILLFSQVQIWWWMWWMWWISGDPCCFYPPIRNMDFFWWKTNTRDLLWKFRFRHFSPAHSEANLLLSVAGPCHFMGQARRQLLGSNEPNEPAEPRNESEEVSHGSRPPGRAQSMSIISGAICWEYIFISIYIFIYIYIYIYIYTHIYTYIYIYMWSSYYIEHVPVSSVGHGLENVRGNCDDTWGVVATVESW